MARRPSSNGGFGTPAEQFVGAGGVDAPAGLAVGFARVPAQLTVEADEPGDRLHRLADRHFVVRAEVDRIDALVALGGEDDGPRRIVDEEVLAARRTRAPDVDLAGTALAWRRRTS